VLHVVPADIIDEDVSEGGILANGSDEANLTSTVATCTAGAADADSKIITLEIDKPL